MFKVRITKMDKEEHRRNGLILLLSLIVVVSFLSLIAYIIQKDLRLVLLVILLSTITLGSLMFIIWKGEEIHFETEQENLKNFVYGRKANRR